MNFSTMPHCKPLRLLFNKTLLRTVSTFSNSVTKQVNLNHNRIAISQKQLTSSAGICGTELGAKALPNVKTTCIKKINLLSKIEFDWFVKEYPYVVADLVTLPQLAPMTETNDWIKRVIDHNVPHGKLLRPMLLLAVARHTQAKTQRDLPNLNKIAWTYEFLQGYATIHDDIMDCSTTRRGRPCWYLMDKVGLSAINDGDILENAAYVLLKKYAHGLYPRYADIIDTLHESFLKLLFGQSLDGRISQDKQYELYTIDIYTKMMEFKNSYYTFYAPITIGLLLNGINNHAILKQVESISLKLGLLYSVQDDFIDCFVDPERSGKVGTDIQDGKPSWLIVSALSGATKRQRQILMENFGTMDPEKVDKVKTIYDEMNLSTIFSQFEKNAVNVLLAEVDMLPEAIPKKPLLDIVHMLNGRTQ